MLLRRCLSEEGNTGHGLYARGRICFACPYVFSHMLACMYAVPVFWTTLLADFGVELLQAVKFLHLHDSRSYH